MATSPRSNRGPGAAAENRAALIAAARAIFATHGLDAPLSAVARQAGVGQGSLYRHFPTRSSLAVAVFQENADELEAIAARPGSTLDDVLRAITDQAIVSTAFFQMIEIERADAAGQELARTIDAILASKLPEARSSGRVPDRISADDVLLGIAMLVGALAKTAVGERRAVAARAWALLPFGPRPRD
jgi:AcrR family transcriptional regulator